jgi:hypothetical protein
VYDASVTALLEEISATLPEGVEAFRKRFSHMFLIRQPKAMVPSDAGSLGDAAAFEYRTSTVTADSDGFLPWQWWVGALVKRPGSHFPESVSVGRATSSDLLIPLKFISKLHARFQVKHGQPLRLEDCNSANGTFINGRKLESGRPIEVRSGDRIGFGSLELDLMDPETCFIAFRARRHSLPTSRRTSGSPPA